MRKLNFSITLIFTLFLTPSFAETNSHFRMGDFSSGILDQWESKTFAGITNYRIISLGNISVLKADSHSSASALIKQQKIDLLKTPFLNWQWRIENRLGKINEQTKSGDDYSARIYVVLDGGWSFWKTKAINYVWASNTPKNTQWPNAFAGNNAMMIALRSANDKTNKWYQEKRNIMDDFKTVYGIDIRYIDAIALMTDTDNAGGKAITYYGDIYFSAH